MTSQLVSAKGYLTKYCKCDLLAFIDMHAGILSTLFIYLSHTQCQIFPHTFNVPVDQVLLVHIVQSLKHSPQDLSSSLPYEVCSCGEYTVGLLRLLQLQDVVVDATPHLADGSREILCIQRGVQERQTE